MKQLHRIIFITITLLASFSCTTLPTLDEMKSEVTNFEIPKKPSKDKAMVYIVRHSLSGSIIKFDVFVDGKEDKDHMGYTRGDQYIYFEVSPGKHTIYSEAETFAEKEIELKAGEIIYINQEVKPGIIMARNNLKEVPETVAKYYIKNGELGGLAS